MIANHERVLFFCSIVRQLSGAVGVSRVAQVLPPKLCMWLLRQLQMKLSIVKLWGSFNSPTLMFSDSQSAKQLVHNPKLHRHTKSTDVQFHLNQEAVLSGEVTVTYIRTHALQPTCLLKLYLQINVFVFAHSLVPKIDSLCSH